MNKGIIVGIIVLLIIIGAGIIILILGSSQDEPIVGGCAGVSLENRQECCENWAQENGIVHVACVGEWTIKDNQCAWECETVENGNGEVEEEFCGKSFKSNAKCGTGKYNTHCTTGGCCGEICHIAGETMGDCLSCEWKDCYNASKYSLSCQCVEGQCVWESDKGDNGDIEPPLIGGCAGVSLENRQECCENWAQENGIVHVACVGEWTIKDNQCAWECEIVENGHSTTGPVPSIIVQLRDNLEQYPSFTEDLVDRDCDAENTCPDGLECYEFPPDSGFYGYEEIGLRCVYVGEYSSPCDWFICPNSWNLDHTCSIAESYPAKIVCS